jgi:DNA-directed RNA polymerase specialized sigma24 family protein
MSAESVVEVLENAATEPDLKDVPLEVLCAQARAQEANFVHGDTSSGAAGLELFRRAIAEGNEDAWAAVISVYRGLLVAQAQRQPLRRLVDEDDGFCADRAFQRFWRATRTGQMQGFSDLASILKYLKMCLASVLLDEARVRRRQTYVSIDDLPSDSPAIDDPSGAVVGQAAGRELWQAVEQELRDESERLVAQLSFVSGLSPREIRARHPDRFAEVGVVYRLKRNVIDRLRRSPLIQELLSQAGS